MHANSFSTIVGDINFAKNGEWTEPRMLMVQYKGIEGNGVDQFRDPGRYTVLFPPAFKSGDVVVPYR